jgi:hypothetical protein
MSRSSRVALTMSLCLSLALVAHARTARADGCKRIRAEINLTTGTIEGNFGLDGTVGFVADSSGTPPSTAPANSNVFSGILTITTDRGTLSMRETGMSSSRRDNPAGSVLTSWGDSPTGTGCFADVVGGDLFFIGRIVGSEFLVDVSGELCR